MSWIHYIIPFYFYLNVLILINPSQSKIEESTNNNQYIELNEKGKYPNECTLCSIKQKKYFRSSHCSICKICILKRDHHCGWANICVGYKNMNHFICYIIWLQIFGYYFLLGLLKTYNKHVKRSIMFKILLLSVGLFDFVIFVFVTNILIQKLVDFLNDRTFYEKLKIKYENYCIFCKNNSVNYENTVFNEFNKGWLYNLKLNIGPTIFHLFLPLFKQIKYPIPELSKDFMSVAMPNKFEGIKGLSGIKYPKLDDILKSQDITYNPKIFIESAKKYYSHPSILII